MRTAPARQSGFRWWLAAATGSSLGDGVTFFAVAWVAAQHGAATASAVLTAEAVPLAVLILVGGVIADRWGIRRVMICCDAAMVAVMGFLAVVAHASGPGMVSVWALVVVGLLAGTASALRRPAGGVFPRLFARGDELATVMATTTVFRQLAMTSGPAVGGVILAAGGLTATSTLDAASFVVVLGVLLVVRPPYEPPVVARGGPSLWCQLADGARALRATPGAGATIVSIVGLAATVLPLVMLCVPLIALDRGWSAATTGVVSAAWVVGGLVVTAVVAKKGMPTAVLAVTGPALAAAGVLLLATTTDPRWGAVAVLTVGVGTSLLTTRLIPRFVTATPAHMLARFQSLLGLAQTGPVLLMTPLLGHLITTLGIRPALVVLAAVLLGTAAAARRAEGQLPATSTDTHDAGHDG